MEYILFHNTLPVSRTHYIQQAKSTAKIRAETIRIENLMKYFQTEIKQPTKTYLRTIKYLDDRGQDLP